MDTRSRDQALRRSSMSRTHRWRRAAVTTIAAVAVAPITAMAAASVASAPPTTEPDEESLPTVLPLAPDEERVDLEPPVFSDPTTIDNPLFPISNLHSVVLLGNDEGHPIRIETTLMPQPVVIAINGVQVEALESQFVEYHDGRIHEVANDWYAQADDGALWYLGEDVFNYEDGVVADTEGTWVAGRDGAPPAMIMPAQPQGGEVFRPENIPGVLMEEVTISEVGVTMDGPTGPVEGCIIARENHTLEGVYEDKWFCPGYGEFFSGVGDSLEGMAVAVPVDAAPDRVPEELTTIYDGSLAIVDAAAAGDWETAATTQATVNEAWQAHQSAAGVPPRLTDQMNRALDALAGDRLVPAVDGRNNEGAANAALDVAIAALDLQLQFRPVTEIDHERFEVWARQLIVDANRLEAVPGFVAADVSTLEWVLPRFGHTLDEATLADLDAQLGELRTVADDEDVAAAAELAPGLLETISAVS
jgi:hypothetical protein